MKKLSDEDRAAEARWRRLERPPTVNRRWDALAVDMTAREAVAARVMAGFAADTTAHERSGADLARYAVMWADALFDALEEDVS